MSVYLIHSTIDDRDAAKELAHELVERNLAACVNIGREVTSVYPWEGSLQTDEEIPLTVKTTGEVLDETMRLLEELHPYDCPEVLATEVDSASDDYREWVENHCG